MTTCVTSVPSCSLPGTSKSSGTSPTATWDKAVESALQKASTADAEKPYGAKELRLATVPKQVHLPEISRTLAGIDKDVRLAIRQTVSGESPWPLFVHGPAGCGKTCAALCLLDYAGGGYYVASELCSRMIDAQHGHVTFSSNGRSGNVWPGDIWKWIDLAPLIVLDELGSRDRVSDFAYETIKRVIDRRACRPFVVLSNWGLAEIGRLYDDRIASRLAAGTVIHLDDMDRRLVDVR